jgi:hypothetical protein
MAEIAVSLALCGSNWRENVQENGFTWGENDGEAISFGGAQISINRVVLGLAVPETLWYQPFPA